MKVAVFSNKPYTETFFKRINSGFGHELVFFSEKLSLDTAELADGCQAICAFVNDDLSAPVLEKLHSLGIRVIALRCAGFNNVDLDTAHRLGLPVLRVPAYSPNAVAEHTIALILALNRHVCRARSRVREGNFELEGMMGFELAGKQVGVIGTGKIGEVVTKILAGFDCDIYAYDPHENPKCIEYGAKYVPLDELLRKCYIITLHCPLMPETRHLINAEAIEKMPECTMLVNTSRGALIDTKAVIDGLKSHKIGYLGLDVYEEEADLFFEDLSNQVIQDDTFARLLMFPNVIVTGHQAFFTSGAVSSIARTTLDNITQYENTGKCSNCVTCDMKVRK